MTVKKLEGEERFEAHKLFVYCFHQRVDNIENERQKQEAETQEDWGAFDDDGKLMARIINNHYDFHLDGQAVKTGGIGGVATYPEYRETGAIREIFKALLLEAYKNGEVLSALFPFNHKFYRKFGYEVVPFRNEYKMHPNVLKDYHSLATEEKCEVRRWLEEDGVMDFLNVYEKFASGFNLSALRTEEMMKEHLKFEKEYIDRNFSYIFSRDGVPVAYLIFKDEFNPQAAVLKVEECAWTCRAGFNSILNFLARFSADYGSIVLPLPKGIDLLKIIHAPNAYEIEKQTCQHFMVRVMNVVKLFEVIRKPADCDFTIKVEDELIEENNLTLRVLADKVEILASADTTAGTAAELTNVSKPDIELDIRALSQLAVGCTSLDEASLRSDVTINGNEEMLRKVFIEKPIIITESF